MARFMGVGDVVVRNDLLYERYRTPRPRVMAALVGSAGGFGPAKVFGPPSATVPTGPRPLLDEHELGVPSKVADPAPVVVLPVTSPEPIVRAEPTRGGLLVAGDGEGLVDLAAAGLLPARAPVRYAGALTSAAEWDAALADADLLVLTDTNRQRARRWGTVRENTGFTQPAGYTPLVDDPTDARLDVFPDGASADRTTVEQRGVEAVRATGYGNPISYTPEDRPANALDGDPTTAWRVGAFADVTGERLRVDLAAPVEASSLRIVQPVSGPRNRTITRARLHFDRGADVDVALEPVSNTEQGQVVGFAARRFQRVDFEVLETDAGLHPRYDGYSGVGLAELDIPGVRVDEVVRLPSALLREAGPRAQSHPLAIVLSRLRASAADPTRGDEERFLRRAFRLPDERRFEGVSGSARISQAVADDVIDGLVGLPTPIEGGVAARSDSRLPGDLRSRASAAIDGDPTTAWQPGLLGQSGHWIEVESGGPISLDRLDLVVVADGRHSVPTRISVTADDGPPTTIDLPAVADRPERGATASIPVTFPSKTGRRLRVTIERVRAATTPDFFGPGRLELPVAVAELGVPGVQMAAPASAFESACRDDLVTVDGRPLPLRLSGVTAAALAGGGLDIATCGVSTALDLSAGDHDVAAAVGSGTGFDLDRLVLRSSPPSPVPATALPAVPPSLRVTATGRSSYEISAGPAAGASWLVLGQSHNRGWRLTIDGRDAGPPVLIDGYANGWRLPPSTATRSLALRWVPQRSVDLALVASSLAVLLCLLIVLAGWRRDRRRPVLSDVDWPPPAELTWRTPDAPALALAIAAGVVAAAAGGMVVGLVVLGVALAARFVPLFRWGFAFGPALALALAAAYVILQQARYGYPPDFAWPVNTERAHLLGLISIGLLLASTGGPFWRPAPSGRTQAGAPGGD